MIAYAYCYLSAKAQARGQRLDEAVVIKHAGLESDGNHSESDMMDLSEMLDRDGTPTDSSGTLLSSDDDSDNDDDNDFQDVDRLHSLLDGLSSTGDHDRAESPRKRRRLLKVEVAAPEEGSGVAINGPAGQSH